MASKDGIAWTKPPVQNIGLPIRKRVERVPQVVFGVGQNGAQQWANQAKVQRPWRDKTNAARAGLTGVAEMEGSNTVIQCFSQVEYGIFLEAGTSFMDAYASILPAMNTVAPVIVANANQAVKTLLGGR